MSRIGKNPITIPSGVTVTFDNGVVTVKGSKGELTYAPNPSMKITMDDTLVTIKRSDDSKESKSLHGLTRSLIQNMVTGVTEGFTKRLEVNGVGYRFQIQGKKIVLSLGYSHPIEYTPNEGVQVAAHDEKKNMIVISGIDKQKVGQAAAEIRAFRKPEPYKGKGIKYDDEIIQRKAGKTAAK
ncbi:MAG: 50S ribosomal protein L6 [Candidatus Peregrinibacteria bacterium]|nr:50S ribosomal protein L6 [Candidatus Peregrinibacteria bacterium]